MNNGLKIFIIILIIYLCICGFFYWFNRSFYNKSDPAQEKLIQFFFPYHAYKFKRENEDIGEQI